MAPISPYFVGRFAFNENCKVVCFSGDNICSLVGILGFSKSKDVIISLGTSDTVFFNSGDKPPAPSHVSHTFPHPIHPSYYITMLCYKNGSKTRESIILEECTWEMLELVVERRSRNKNRRKLIGHFYQYPEITPNTGNLAGEFLYEFDTKTKSARLVKNATTEERILTCIESRCLAIVNHLEKLGVSIMKDFDRIIVTGGASANISILQILSDILKLPIYSANVPDSASLGAAKRAMYGIHGFSLGDMMEPLTLMATPKYEYDSAYYLLHSRTEEALLHDTRESN